MNDPIRLKDEPQAATALREDLERIQRVAPQAYDTSAGLSRLHGGIAAATASTALKGAIWPWVTAAGLVSATLLGYSATRLEQAPPRPRAATSANSIAPGVPGAATEHVTKPRESQTIELSAFPSQPAAPPSLEPDPDVQLRLETAHLARARAVMEQAPADALRLAQQGERRFSGGMFGQERQAIIVLSSLRLRHASAESHAQGFLHQYPHSSLADRIRAELAHSSEMP